MQLFFNGNCWSGVVFVGDSVQSGDGEDFDGGFGWGDGDCGGEDIQLVQYLFG